MSYRAYNKRIHCQLMGFGGDLISLVPVPVHSHAEE